MRYEIRLVWLVCLQRVRSILMANWTMTTYCWRCWHKRGFNSPELEHLITDQGQRTWWGAVAGGVGQESPAGSRDKVPFRPWLFHSHPGVSNGQQATKQNHSQEKTSCPFCSHSHSTHMLLWMHFTAYCSLTCIRHQTHTVCIVCIGARTHKHAHTHAQRDTHSSKWFKWLHAHLEIVFFFSPWGLHYANHCWLFLKTIIANWVVIFCLFVCFVNQGNIFEFTTVKWLNY